MVRNGATSEDVGVELRQAFSAFPTGVVAVCALGDDGRPLGMAVNSFTSISLDPPLVAISLANTSQTWPALAGKASLGLSVLGTSQEQVSRQLSSRSGDRFDGVEMGQLRVGCGTSRRRYFMAHLPRPGQDGGRGPHYRRSRRERRAVPSGHRAPCVPSQPIPDDQRVKAHLGRFLGTVVHGDGRGRTLGFPTANLDVVPHHLPLGVYAAWVRIEHESSWREATVSYGGNPTFGELPVPQVVYFFYFSSPRSSAIYTTSTATCTDSRSRSA